jgi:hypothetical protein
MTNKSTENIFFLHFEIKHVYFLAVVILGIRREDGKSSQQVLKYFGYNNKYKNLSNQPVASTRPSRLLVVAVLM